MGLIQIGKPPAKEVDLTIVYDAVVVGSGAAGGMAAHVLTSRGLKVLLLEAGKKLDINAELKSMQWPYDHPRRGEMPPGSHALTLNEYTIRQPPYAQPTSPHKHVYSYVQGWGGSDYSKNIVVDEKDHPYTGTNYAWVRARCLGGKTNIWGRLALRLSDYRLQGEVARRLRRGLADLLRGHRAVLRQGRSLPRHLGPERESAASARQPLPAPDQAERGGSPVTERLARMDRVLTPYRAGVTTDGLKHNKYRSKCFGRGACGRRVGGCDIHAAFDSPTGLIYPALDTGNLTLRTNATAREVLVDPKTGKARGVAFIDTDTGRSLRGERRRSWCSRPRRSSRRA